MLHLMQCDVDRRSSNHMLMPIPIHPMPFSHSHYTIPHKPKYQNFTKAPCLAPAKIDRAASPPLYNCKGPLHQNTSAKPSACTHAPAHKIVGARTTNGIYRKGGGWPYYSRPYYSRVGPLLFYGPYYSMRHVTPP